jgi:AcrR family transcriptional regulator
MGRKTETKQNILSAAIKEFAKNPYHLANTNVIAAKAGISKGTVFLHYKSKSELYLACLKHLVEKNYAEAQDLEIEQKEDVFERMVAIIRWKSERLKRFPDEFLFVYRALYNCPEEIKPQVYGIIASFSREAKEKYFINSGINYGKYSQEQVLNFIQIINMGVEAKIKNNMGKEINEKDIDAYLREALELLEILKKGLISG